MVALVAPAEDQQRLTEEALAVARRSSDESARNWDASLLNNLGMIHADAGDWPAALAAFEEALAARERESVGDAGRTRVARWMVGWALRNLGRTDEARAVQTALKASWTQSARTTRTSTRSSRSWTGDASRARGVPSGP